MSWCGEHMGIGADDLIDGECPRCLERREMGLPRIVGVTGYARHGKDTVAGVLVKELGYTRVALADIMKQALLVLNPIVRQYTFPKHPDTLQGLVGLLGWDKAKHEPEVRRLLQTFGTEVGRKMLSEDIWIDAAVRATKGFYGTDRRIVFSDIRFLNEAQFIRRVPGGGGEVWKVERFNSDGTPYDNGIGIEHDSEREIGSIVPDETFRNDHDEGYLQGQVFRYLQARTAFPLSRGQGPEPTGRNLITGKPIGPVTKEAAKAMHRVERKIKTGDR